MKKKIFFTITVYLLLIISLPHLSYARRLYYAEEFYLYVLNLYYTNPNLERNIRFLQWALEAPFDNPVRSLARIQTEEDFKRYKALFKLHVNLLIIDSYLQLGRRFDKEHVYFFNLWYAKHLKESFTIAKYYYEISLNYWEEALKYAEALRSMQGRIDIDQWEDELEQILSGELNYRTIIQEPLGKLEIKREKVEAYLMEKEKKETPDPGKYYIE
ncbi:MAG: hypothetical protein ACUVWJ_12510 [Spirochaetota bacterium]